MPSSPASNLPSERHVQRVIASFGRYVERLSRLPAAKIAHDVLDERKAHEQIALFCETFGLTPEELRGRRLLEVGSGYGTFVRVARKHYGIEAWGIEPGTEGFDTSVEISRDILREAGLPPESIIDGCGEDLPFPDGHFDLVFSSTVLEHTADPELVLDEAVRVLRPGGCMQFVFPNYGAFYEGHYAIPWLPHAPKFIGRLWVRLWGRDPAFLDTLQFTTARRTRQWLRQRDDVALLSLGESVFRRRMTSLAFSTWAGLARLQGWLRCLHRWRLTNLATSVLLRLQSFDPIILSLRKTPPPQPPPDNLDIYFDWDKWLDMKVHGPTSRWLRQLIDDQLARIPPDRLKSVLDVGCGEGTTTHHMARALPAAQVLGIDRSASGVARASSRYLRDNLAFRSETDLATLSSGSFSLVTCFEVLEHVPDWRELTRELHRLSSEFVLVSFPTGRMRPFERNVGHLRNFRPGQFERFARRIGLVPVAVSYAGFPFYSPLFREVCNWTNSGSTLLTTSHYGWARRRLSDVILFAFRHLSTQRRAGDQFCGLFRKESSAPET